MLFRRVIGSSYVKYQGISSSACLTKKASPLAELRKRSGYSLSLCKNALASNDNDVDKAFKWLQVSGNYLV